MTTQFLVALHGQAAALRAKIHAANAGVPVSRGPNPVTGQPTNAIGAPIPAAGHYEGRDYRNLSDIESDATKLVAAIEAEIDRPLTAAEYESQLLNRAPLPGETPAMTASRLANERARNPLLPHQTPNPSVVPVHPAPAEKR